MTKIEEAIREVVRDELARQQQATEKPADLPVRHDEPSEAVLDYVISCGEGGCSRNDVAMATGVDTAQVRKHLLEWVKDGRIRVSGIRRGTRYHAV